LRRIRPNAFRLKSTSCAERQKGQDVEEMSDRPHALSREIDPLEFDKGGNA